MTNAPKRTLVELARAVGLISSQMKAHMAQASHKGMALPKATAHSKNEGDYYDTREFMVWWRAYRGRS